MRNDIILTTTNQIEGKPIKRYLGLVKANVVVGNNVFSEFAASITDIVGGFSNVYEEKMDILYKKALEQITEKARRLGADCVVGLKVDFDEISSKGKAMFMVSVIGTACSTHEQGESQNGEMMNGGMVTQSELKEICECRKATSSLKENLWTYIPSEWMKSCMRHPTEELVEMFTKRYLSNADSDVRQQHEDFLASCPESLVVPVFYNHYAKDDGNRAVDLLDLIVKLHLFDPHKTYEILRKNLHRGIALLSSDKSAYTGEDLEWMRKTREYLDALPDTGQTRLAHVGLIMKKEVKQLICENGHVTDNSVFCYYCGCDVKGLHANERDMIASFKERLEALEDIMERHG